MKERIARLYEQGACAARIGQYILRWVQWLLGGLFDYLPLFVAQWNEPRRAQGEALAPC